MDLNLTFNNNTICINTRGSYKGCDGENYSYATTYVEGTGVQEVWDYIKFLENKVKRLEYRA